MTSKLVLDNIAGRTTAGSITIVGEGNSTTTNLQQGLAKFFSRTAADGASTNDSFNQSGLTDTASGRQDFAFTNNMASTNYAAHVQPHDGFANEPAVNTIATTGFRGDCNDDTAGDRQDVSQGNTVHGDLA
jgi:hypothetical protein